MTAFTLVDARLALLRALGGKGVGTVPVLAPALGVVDTAERIVVVVIADVAGMEVLFELVVPIAMPFVQAITVVLVTTAAAIEVVAAAVFSKSSGHSSQKILGAHHMRLAGVVV